MSTEGGRYYELHRCGAKSKRTGEQCKQWSFPFSSPPRCKWHGAYNPWMIERAREAAEQFALGAHPPHEPAPSEFEKEIRLRRYYDAVARWERRQIKKNMSDEGWTEYKREEAVAKKKTKARKQAETEKRRVERKKAERERYERMLAERDERPAASPAPKSSPPPSSGEISIGRPIEYEGFAGLDWDV